MALPSLAQTTARPGNGPDWLGAQEAREDIRQLRTDLEATHPDPFLRAGGMVAFRKRFNDAEAAIPAAGIDRTAFVRLLRPLLAQVGDGHTWLDVKVSENDAQVLVDLASVEERLVVTGVYDPSQLSMVGATVQAIEGLPVATLAERVGARQGYDNVYKNLEHLRGTVASANRLADLLERPALTGPVSFQVLLPSGEPAVLKAPLRPGARTGRLTLPSRLHLPPVDGAGMAAGFLDEADQVGYLRLDSAIHYREAFEMWQMQGMDATRFLDRVVEDVSGKKPSGSEAEKLALVPSVTERLISLMTQMKAHQTPLLIVDLRENQGGQSVFADILEYFLYPLDSIVRLDHGYQIPRYSSLYFQSHSSDTLAKVQARTTPDFQIGDLDFTEMQQWSQLRSAPPSPETLQRLRQEFLTQMHGLPSFAKALDQGSWNAVWTPRVVVLTSARTYSAGFDGVLQLHAHGAAVVGVPSSQAANCFIDAVRFQLKHSGLTGSISYKWSVGLPLEPQNGTLLHPDRELSYADFKKFNFDPHATILLALEFLSVPYPPAAENLKR
jgi:hypothetical protein